MEQIVRPFINFARIRAKHRSSVRHTRIFLGQLRCRLEAYSVNSERDSQQESFAAENLMNCLYNERMVLLDVEPTGFIKIVRLLWEFEDRGYIAPSSLINDLAIRILLEVCQDARCKSIAISALQQMFVTAMQENKRILDAVLLSAVGNNAVHIDMLDAWERAIVSSIGKSSMRMEVVESALLEKCSNAYLIGNNLNNSLLQCIASASSSSLFDWSKIRGAIIQQIYASEEKTAIAYVRFLCALANLSNSDPIYSINELIIFLKTTKRHEIDLQCSIYEAIDDLKEKTSTNVYQEPFFKIFSNRWEPTSRDTSVEEHQCQNR